MNKIIKGSIYFKYDDNNNLKSIRIIGFKNRNILKTVDVYTNKISFIDINDLDEYTLLRPDGYIHFNIVTLPDFNNTGKIMHDVVVLLYTIDDLSNVFAVCRQNTAGFHSNMINITKEENMGFSVSRSTCPPNVVFEQFLQCNDLLLTESISVYIGDTLDTIFQCIKNKEFDRTLDAIFTDYISLISNGKKDVELILKDIPCFKGYCKDLRTLLEFNEFMDDILYAFNITKINSIIPVENDTGVIVDDEVIRNIIFELNITNPLWYKCIPYDKDIELNDIKFKYNLISDIHYNIYVFVYDSNDDFVISDYEKLSNAEKANMINKLTDN